MNLIAIPLQRPIRDGVIVPGPRSLRIAIYTYGLPVVGERRGGIERVAHELADGLGRRGHEITVWTHDPRPAGSAYQTRELPWKRFSTSWLGRRMTMGYLGNILAVLPRYGDVDAIIAHGDSVLLPLRGRRVVRVMYGSALAEALTARTPWRFLLQIGVYGQELVTAALQSPCVGISDNTCCWNPLVQKSIRLGVDLSRFFPDPRAKTPQPSIMFVGALGGRKRGRLLLEWFARTIRPRFPNATLDMVCELGPASPGVVYRRGLANGQLAALYRRAWVYASPSAYEGFGLPYLEAMASGTPVIATPNPGSRELLGGGKFGLLRDDRSFPGALERLLADDTRRRHWAAQGLARAQEFSLPRMIDQYERLLLDLCRK